MHGRTTCTGGGGAAGRGVTDDTGDVIPLTSASNLQHEKDTPVTPYLPPNHLPPPARLLLNVWLSFSLSLISAQIKQRIGLPKVPYRNSQSNTQKEAVFIHFCRSDLRLH